ncbi:hypothetical protein BS50DRAFT_628709 [Corynespora cassiicola Philippines]|uniref:Uncharacterized protein n=1 Tax=Corynespora cassiicola Philippines TaxID=1448308 RepID=A0A2T2PD11_CORCC|nr:hypothetical protein BS50DRAFT_628709 [Corynespora cassiicola Philippines]
MPRKAAARTRKPTPKSSSKSASELASKSASKPASKPSSQRSTPSTRGKPSAPSSASASVSVPASVPASVSTSTSASPSASPTTPAIPPTTPLPTALIPQTLALQINALILVARELEFLARIFRSAAAQPADADEATARQGWAARMQDLEVQYEELRGQVEGGLRAVGVDGGKTAWPRIERGALAGLGVEETGEGEGEGEGEKGLKREVSEVEGVEERGAKKAKAKGKEKKRDREGSEVRELEDEHDGQGGGMLQPIGTMCAEIPLSRGEQMRMVGWNWGNEGKTVVHKKGRMEGGDGSVSPGLGRWRFGM